jgi:hypothetical protein
MIKKKKINNIMPIVTVFIINTNFKIRKIKISDKLYTHKALFINLENKKIRNAKDQLKLN